MNVARFPVRCAEPRLSELVTAYCFGDIFDEERRQLEDHLLVCDFCWEQVEELTRSVAILRNEPEVMTTISPREFVGLLGMSSKLDRLFAGHLGFVTAIAILYGIEWMLGLWTDLGYAYDRFGSLAWALSIPTALWAGIALLAGLWSDTKTTRDGQTSGLLRSAGIALVSLGLLTAVMFVFLPAERTIQASFQTRTASGGYFKNAVQIFLPLLIFILPSFHTIVQLQKDLAQGRHRSVLSVIARAPERILPRGMPFLSPVVLSAILAVLGLIKLVGANRMLDALSPGPYAQLFTVASYVSTTVWFAIALLSILWFTSNLNELKRECAALALVDRHPEPSPRR